MSNPPSKLKMAYKFTEWATIEISDFMIPSLEMLAEIQVRPTLTESSGSLTLSIKIPS